MGSTILVGAAIGLLAGAAVGLVPLGAGAYRHRLAYGLAGLAASAAAGAILGLILAVPVALLFTAWMLFSMRRVVASSSAMGSSNTIADATWTAVARRSAAASDDSMRRAA